MSLSTKSIYYGNTGCLCVAWCKKISWILCRNGNYNKDKHGKSVYCAGSCRLHEMRYADSNSSQKQTRSKNFGKLMYCVRAIHS